MATTWYWIGTAAVASGSVVFGVGAARAEHRPREVLYTLTFFIGLVALARSLTMATGSGAYVSAAALRPASTAMRNGEFMGDEAARRTTVPRRPLGTA